MSYPGPLTPDIFSTEDKGANDGAIIDSFLIETDAPPNLKDATEPVDPPATKEIKPLTKLLTRHQLVAISWGLIPISLLNGDAKRHGVGIRVWSPTSVATDGVRVASDIGDLATGGVILHNQTIPGDSFNDHTGPVWVQSFSATTGLIASADVFVEYWSVTE